MMIAGRHSGQSSLAQGWTGARDDERHFIFNKFSAGRMFTFDLMRQHTKHQPLWQRTGFIVILWLSPSKSSQRFEKYFQTKCFNIFRLFGAWHFLVTTCLALDRTGQSYWEYFNKSEIFNICLSGSYFTQSGLGVGAWWWGVLCQDWSRSLMRCQLSFTSWHRTDTLSSKDTEESSRSQSTPTCSINRWPELPLYN